ncbi:pilus assembly protein TadE [Kocuria sp. CNJ-770]|uniref:TadE/TadG family type IV pilus assembly protein n=1 Tax=Kocuria sp. CNJ-770 TaxID=1904964 RepID=UPI0009624021|nr:TadE/TadG family type IV pilus assembly protein [Kocuria sp. CNJ-770]OLT06697.1 pilus assembly protein TadE [Kocuria sp. CNJ-770]
MSLWRSERGAAAVEFALVVPILLTLLLGVIEFGHYFNTQISATHAAREAARTMSITGNWIKAEDAARKASPTLKQPLVTVTRDPLACSPGATVSVTVTYKFDSYTGVVKNKDLIGRAAQRCGG